MDIASSTSIITGGFTSLGGGVATVLTAFIGLALAVVLFKFGYRKIKGAIR